MQTFTKKVHLKGKPTLVHGLLCGKVAIKSSAIAVKNPGTFATISAFPDKNFGPLMPVWVWVIEHPEGIFMIDTGEISAVHTPGFFKPLGWLMNYYFTKQMQFEVDRADEVDQQLQSVGLAVNEVSEIIMTHIHIDHIDGIKHFPNTPILVNELEWHKQHGTTPQLFPDWFEPTLVQLNQSYKNFPKAHSLTNAKDLMLVETPGHTFGHCSVFLEADEGLICFAGDAAYYNEQLFEETFSATIASKKLALTTYQKFIALAQQEPLILLPSHDEKAMDNLSNFKTI